MDDITVPMYLYIFKKFSLGTSKLTHGRTYCTVPYQIQKLQLMQENSQELEAKCIGKKKCQQCGGRITFLEQPRRKDTHREWMWISH